MIVVDSQVHVWAPNTPDNPWVDPAHATGHRFTDLAPARLLREMDEAGVDRAVLVPPAFEGDRNDLALAAACEFPDRFAAVVRLPLRQPGARTIVENWRSVEGLRGVRVTFTREKRGWLHDGTADWFWAAAERTGVPVMVYAPGATPTIASVARAHPCLKLAFDHLGIEGAAGSAELSRAVAELEQAASLPNVSVKASALLAHVADEYPFRVLHEPIKRVVAAFGPSRVFWGSDLSRLRCSYREAVEYMSQIDGLTPSELSWIMGRAVAEWLDWPL